MHRINSHKKHATAILMIFLNIISYSQTIEVINQKLSFVQNDDSIQDLKNHKKSIEKTFGKSFTKMDTSDRYRFLFMYEIGWKENCPSPECRFKINGYYISSNSSVFSAIEINNIFKLHDGLLINQQDTITLDRLFINFGGEPDLNSKQFLRLNNGHYYPHGNQSSWMIDRLYYFEIIAK